MNKGNFDNTIWDFGESQDQTYPTPTDQTKDVNQTYYTDSYQNQEMAGYGQDPYYQNDAYGYNYYQDGTQQYFADGTDQQYGQDQYQNMPQYMQAPYYGQPQVIMQVPVEDEKAVKKLKRRKHIWKFVALFSLFLLICVVAAVSNDEKEESRSSKKETMNQSKVVSDYCGKHKDSLTEAGFMEDCYAGDYEAFKSDCSSIHFKDGMKDTSLKYQTVKFTGFITDYNGSEYFVSETGMWLEELTFHDARTNKTNLEIGEYVTLYGVFYGKTKSDIGEHPWINLIAVDKANYLADGTVSAIKYTYSEEEQAFYDAAKDSIKYLNYIDIENGYMNINVTSKYDEELNVLFQVLYYDAKGKLIFIGTSNAPFAYDQEDSFALVELPHKEGDRMDLVEFADYDLNIYIYRDDVINNYMNCITNSIENNNDEELIVTFSNNTNKPLSVLCCMYYYDENYRVLDMQPVRIEPFTGTCEKVFPVETTDCSYYSLIYSEIID